MAIEETLVRRSAILPSIGIGLLLVFGPPEMASYEDEGVLELPEPRGEFAVGTVSFLWEDDSRSEGATEDLSDRRKLPRNVSMTLRHWRFAFREAPLLSSSPPAQAARSTAKATLEGVSQHRVTARSSVLGHPRARVSAAG